MKTVILFLIGFLPVTLFSQWMWKNPLPTGNNLQSVSFADGMTGYSVGDCGTIVKTGDGGMTWVTHKIATTATL